ncbi:MAG: UMP kinase [Clostridia bacterium]|nr:UMP kinase [Clostridia bacterium]MBR6754733.1 UMP kinase [Clostridia bacterium]
MANQYKRVLVKLSGEALSGEGNRILNGDMLTSVADVISRLVKDGTQVCIVIGAGNIWRGARQNGLSVDRVRGDHMGMLATVINSIAMQDYIIKTGVNAHVMSAVQIQQFCEPYSQYKAIEYLENNEVVILSCGVGYPFFSTDTGMMLRAAELKCDAVLSAKNVNGVYDKDPAKYPDAKKFDELTYSEMLSLGLKAIDQSAATIGEESGIKTVLFPLSEPDNIIRAANGENIGTLIHN